MKQISEQNEYKHLPRKKKHCIMQVNAALTKKINAYVCHTAELCKIPKSHSYRFKYIITYEFD